MTSFQLNMRKSSVKFLIFNTIFIIASCLYDQHNGFYRCIKKTYKQVQIAHNRLYLLGVVRLYPTKLKTQWTDRYEIFDQISNPWIYDITIFALFYLNQLQHFQLNLPFELTQPLMVYVYQNIVDITLVLLGDCNPLLFELK